MTTPRKPVALSVRNDSWKTLKEVQDYACKEENATFNYTKKNHGCWKKMRFNNLVFYIRTCKNRDGMCVRLEKGAYRLFERAFSSTFTSLKVSWNHVPLFFLSLNLLSPWLNCFSWSDYITLGTEMKRDNLSYHYHITTRDDESWYETIRIKYLRIKM